MNPKETLVHLKLNSSAKVCKTLEAIYQVCKEQEERGIFEFSPKVIAKLGRGRGIPKEQSLRNKTGEKYRALMNAFELYYPNKMKKGSAPVNRDWIDEIQNPKHRLLARSQEAELKAAKRLLKDISPPGERINVYDFKGTGYQEEFKLSDVERRALTYILSKDFLSKWQFTISEYGEVIDQYGNIVLKAATRSAIEKCLTYL